MKVAALLALLLLGQGAADQRYQVQPGDTLSSLARRSGSTPAQLRQLNTLSGDQLRAGQWLQLPGGSVDQPVGSPASAGSAVSADTPGPGAAIVQRGLAVYYPGRPATLNNGARTVLTAAHLSLPFGTWVEVVHARTGRSVLVMINDRGPFGRPERVIDLSQAAARALGILDEGVAPVTLRVARAP